MSEQKDFVIRDGELVCYLGNAADIVIPEGVHRIGMGTFIERKNIRSVILPKSLCWIGQSAFAHCENLKSIVIPANVTFIDKCAFSDSGLEEIVIEGKPEIRLWAFDGTPWKANESKKHGGVVSGTVLLSVNPELTTYTIPSNVKIIGRDAFKNSKIKELDIPKGVTKLDICAFAYSKIERISLPDTLKVVDAYAFSNCTNLTELIIPKSITRIGDCAFEELPNCVLTILNECDDEEIFRVASDSFGRRTPNIKKIRVPYGSAAMRYAMKSGLNVITLPCSHTQFGNSKKHHYIDDVFCCEGSTLHEYFGHQEVVHVPEGIRTIGDNAFTNADVKKVYLPKSVKRIEKFGFASCDNLIEIVGDGTKEIELYAFHNCKALQRVSFPQLEKYIDIAFIGCDALDPENLNFPENAVAVRTHWRTCPCLGSKPIEGKVHAGAKNIIDE